MDDKVPTFAEDFHNRDLVSKMPYQQLGNTDMMVSKLSFGAAPFGNIYRETSEEELDAVLKLALNSGMNLIDTAPWYGHGKSETVLGKLLVGVPRKAYYLNTKVGRYSQEVEKMFDFRAERVIQSVDESLQRLGAEYIDVIQIHDMEFAPNLDIIVNETLPALLKVVEAKKARYIGITGYPMENFKTVMERSQVKIDSLLTYCHGSLNDSSLLDYLPLFQERGVGVINGSILSMGLLTERGPPSWHPAGEYIRNVCKEAVEYCKSQDVDVARIATHHSLQLPGIHSTLVGTANAKNLQSNLDVMWNGVTQKEKDVSEHVVKTYFKPMEKVSWEGEEVAKYRRKLEKARQNNAEVK